jgi:very-short-patch-repair endonuclease
MGARSRLRRRVGLDTVLGDVSEGAHSVLELAYLKTERTHRLPTARRQARLLRAGRAQYLDAFYEEYQVAVELDGGVAHPAETRWRDIRRDNAGAAEGILTLRYSYADVTERPCEVAAEVGRVLQSRGWPGLPHRCGQSCTLAKPDRP